MKSPLTITIIALVTGLLFLFYGHSIPGARRLDSSLVRLYTPYNALIDHDDFIKGRVSFRPLVGAKALHEKYQVIAITDDPDHIFETSPPSPLDYAVILDALHEQGHKSVVLATRVAWDNFNEMELTALNAKLSIFDQSIIPLPVTRGANKATIPPSLKRSLIPVTNITGPYQALPVVNQVTIPNHANGGEHTYAGFSKIESAVETDKITIQMLAQWEGEGVIPSIELLTLMSAYDTTPSEITVHDGEIIQLGTTGMHIPIDQFGRALIHLKEKTEITLIQTINAETLMEKTERSPTDTPPLIAIIQATGGNVVSTNDFSQKGLHHLMAAATQLNTPGDEFNFFKTSLWIEAIMLINLSLFIYIILGLGSSSRHILFLLLSLVILAVFLMLMTILSNWIFISAPLATLLTAWILNTLFYKGYQSTT